MKNKQYKHLKKLHHPWKHQNSINTLTKLIRLMEVTGRHNFIRTEASDLVFWNLRFTEMLSLNNKWYHWKNWLRLGIYTCFEQAKTVLFSHHLFGGIHHILCKSILHINTFSNGEQFDSQCLYYAYQLVQSLGIQQ